MSGMDAYGDPLVPDEPYPPLDPIDAFVWAVVQTGDPPLIEDALRAGQQLRQEEARE